jgi:hypothetical protein
MNRGGRRHPSGTPRWRALRRYTPWQALTSPLVSLIVAPRNRGTCSAHRGSPRWNLVEQHESRLRSQRS